MECKCCSLALLYYSAPELIDTLWNVNELSLLVAVLGFRINRYIMECKFFHTCNFSFGLRWINRYIMECKYIPFEKLYWPSAGINRYIMECKYKEMRQGINTKSGINRYIMECK